MTDLMTDLMTDCMQLVFCSQQLVGLYVLCLVIIPELSAIVDNQLRASNGCAVTARKLRCHVAIFASDCACSKACAATWKLFFYTVGETIEL